MSRVKRVVSTHSLELVTALVTVVSVQLSTDKLLVTTDVRDARIDFSFRLLPSPCSLLKVHTSD